MAFNATDYIITPRDIFLFLKSFLRSGRDRVKLALLVAVFLAALLFGAGVVNALFLAYFFSVFAYDIAARISLSLALLLLVLIVFVMLIGPYTEFINDTTWPEPMSVWVYYFLAIGVLTQLKEMVGASKPAQVLAMPVEVALENKKQQSKQHPLYTVIKEGTKLIIIRRGKERS